jgi:hypothetical protein
MTTGPAGGVIDPFMVPTRNGALVAIDRKSGALYIYNQTNDVLSRLGDASIQLDVSEPRMIAAPDASSMILFGRPVAEPGELVAREYNFTCMMEIRSRDFDGDGVPDIVDNCPEVANGDDPMDPNAPPAQADHDGDGLGDACDPDDDNDGRRDENDVRRDPQGMIVADLSRDADDDEVEDDADNDNDGRPDTSDRLPLDHDNDGLPDSVDNDDDNDGSPDGSDPAPRDARLVDGMGRLVYVRAAGQSRTIEVLELGEGSLEPIVVDSGGIESLYEPRLWPGGTFVLSMTDSVGAATEIAWLPYGDTMLTPRTYSIGLALRGVEPLQLGGSDNTELITVLATHEKPGEDGIWQLARITLSPIMIEALLTQFPDISAPSISGVGFGVLASPGDCTDCRLPYTGSSSVPFTGAQLLTTEVRDGQRIHSFLPGRHVVVAPASDGDGMSAYRIINGSVIELRPPERPFINSAVVLGGRRHVIVSASRDGTDHDLWLYNDRTQSWTELVDAPDELVELDWKP